MALQSAEEATVGATLYVLRDAEAVLSACEALLVNSALAAQAAALAGSAVLVLGTDPIDGTVHCRTASVGDVWLAAAALTLQSPQHLPAVQRSVCGPCEEYEVLAATVKVFSAPHARAQEVGTMTRGELVEGVPHRCGGRTWLRRGEDAWLCLEDAPGRALLQVARLMEVRVRNGYVDEEEEVRLPAAANVKRLKAGLRWPGQLRLARCLAGEYQESQDADPVSQDFHVLAKDMSFGEGQLAREVRAAEKEPLLRRCRLEPMGPLAVRAILRSKEGGLATLRIACSPRYPLANPSIHVETATSPIGEEGVCGLIGTGCLVPERDPAWEPCMTVSRVLKAALRLMETWPGFLFSSLLEAVELFLDARLRVAYIGIGCGGSSLTQQLPGAVQLRHYEKGGNCLLALVDPFLRHPVKPRNAWSVAHDPESGMVVCSCNAFVEDWDLEGLAELIERVSKHVAPADLFLADCRGASFMCAPCPINVHLPPACRGKFSLLSEREAVALDASAYAVLKAVHGIDKEEDRDLLEAMAKKDSCLSFGKAPLTSQELGLVSRLERRWARFRTELPSQTLLLA